MLLLFVPLLFYICTFYCRSKNENLIRGQSTKIRKALRGKKAMTKRKKKKGRKLQKGRKKKGNRKNFKRFTDLNNKFTDLMEKVITNYKDFCQALGPSPVLLDTKPNLNQSNSKIENQNPSLIGTGVTLKSHGPPPQTRLLTHHIAACSSHPPTFTHEGVL